MLLLIFLPLVTTTFKITHAGPHRGDVSVAGSLGPRGSHVVPRNSGHGGTFRGNSNIYVSGLNDCATSHLSGFSHHGGSAGTPSRADSLGSIGSVDSKSALSGIISPFRRSKNSEKIRREEERVRKSLKEVERSLRREQEHEGDQKVSRLTCQSDIEDDELDDNDSFADSSAASKKNALQELERRNCI
jgi:hypothetical protein